MGLPDFLFVGAIVLLLVYAGFAIGREFPARHDEDTSA